MSYHKAATGRQAGFTLIELMVVIMLISIIGTTFLIFFKSSFFNYLNLQSDATTMTQVNTQANRVAQVMRGVTGITSVGANDFQGYSYFYPQDTYVSVVHYYLQTSGGVTKVLADVTPMSANPPIGSPITAKLKTYTIIDSFYQPSGGSLFTYLDSSGNTLSLPITDLQTIKGIQVSMAAKLSNNKNQALSVQVSLRNRKTNL
jgi:prepilin-type N-terminal cleavage/methylation domain-containing protein